MDMALMSEFLSPVHALNQPQVIEPRVHITHPESQDNQNCQNHPITRTGDFNEVLMGPEEKYKSTSVLKDCWAANWPWNFKICPLSEILILLLFLILTWSYVFHWFQRGRRRESKHLCERETLTGCLSFIPSPAIELTTWVCALIGNRTNEI